LIKISKFKILDESQKKALFWLWNNEYPAKLCYNEITQFENYLSQLQNTNHYLIYDDFKNISAWAFTFDRENSRWFAIILDKKTQNKGIGTQLLQHLKAEEKKLYGWVIDHENDFKVDGTKYKSPLIFYTINGFEILPKQRLEFDMISAVKIKWEKQE